MFYTTRSKLILSFAGVSLLVGIVSLVVGSQLLYNSVLNEARARISFDLNAAREIYISKSRTIHTALTIISLDENLKTNLKNRRVKEITKKLQEVSLTTELDFAGVVTPDGNTLCRIGPNQIPEKEEESINPAVQYVLKNKKPVYGTVILEREYLVRENPHLAEQAIIELIPTPRAAPSKEEVETSGMALCSGIPIYDSGNMIGIIYGGVLLNRSTEIVDTVRETVFQGETYGGRSIGTATIFLKDLRISTNVLTSEGERAIGTRVSKEVRDRVLMEGKRWTGRAFVVSDWYITAYEPIKDIFGKRVGILYTGVLEDKYVDMRRHMLSVYILITIAGMGVAVGIGFFLAHRIADPVRKLIQASKEVARGNLNPDIGPVSKSEIGLLQNTFSEMLNSLKERDIKQRAESEIKLLQSEKQASVGRLAAGVAHEINNPLTGVLTFTHMLLRKKDLDEEIKKDLQTIARETERVRKIVKGLLDFSRQTVLQEEPIDIDELIKSTIALVENQALVKGLELEYTPGKQLPMINGDKNQLQSVLLNIIMNAFDATQSGGKITIKTGLSLSSRKTERKGIELSITDTGCGIPQENLDKLFDPFFTTKEVGQGTGLGLAVSYGIVERHGGTIRVQSEVGKGSNFTIWLPLEEKVEA